MRRPILIGILAVLFTASPVHADTINSKHNLSVSGPGTITAQTEGRVCIFCHTPHNANPAVPLWNHELSSVGSYSTYSSTTFTVATPLDQPSGSSKLCLSCHDGTVALGQTVNDGLITVLNTGALGEMPAGSSNLTTDLTDDHPVSFAPNLVNLEVVNPPPGDPVALDNAGQVQCTSCHDPHTEDRDPTSLKFLVKINQGSAICTTCHRPDLWDTNPSSHQSSPAVYTAAQGAHTGYTTVQDNGCESCHRPHTGNTPERLLKFSEEATCDACHDGSVAAGDVSADFLKPYTHPSYSITPSVHDPTEFPGDPTFPMPEIDSGALRHAECPDCHNPHGSYSQAATPPNPSGALSGVWGVDASGGLSDPVVAEYEVCYKCHGDSANKPQEGGLPNPPYVQRQIVQFNTRLEFDPLNPSHHAVVAPGVNADVPSLILPYTVGSIIYCTDCHNSDTSPAAGGSGPNGPHGSTHNHLLERNLNIGADNAGKDYATMYALCFKCHSEASILADESFADHKRHIDREDSSCILCHDPHGVSATQGNSTNNSHLINFDTSVILPNTDGILEFVDYGLFTGGCYLKCHNKNHNPSKGSGDY